MTVKLTGGLRATTVYARTESQIPSLWQMASWPKRAVFGISSGAVEVFDTIERNCAHPLFQQSWFRKYFSHAFFPILEQRYRPWTKLTSYEVNHNIMNFDLKQQMSWKSDNKTNLQFSWWLEWEKELKSQKMETLIYRNSVFHIYCNMWSNGFKKEYRLPLMTNFIDHSKPVFKRSIHLFIQHGSKPIWETSGSFATIGK